MASLSSDKQRDVFMMSKAVTAINGITKGYFSVIWPGVNIQIVSES